MKILGQLTVLPRLPKELERLEELAHNLYWSFKADARALFRQLDRQLWEEVQHNPVALLRDVAQSRLDAAAEDGDYLGLYAEVLAGFDAYLAERTWHDEVVGEGNLYAYLCAEYGWTEAVALYPGGLGVLAGDHTKAASDLGVPLVAVGLYYPEGYFHQRVAGDGQQEAVYLRADPDAVPFRRLLGSDGEPVAVTVDVFGQEVTVQALEAHVGRVRVILLDTDVGENSTESRALLARLYGGDQRTRVAQEMVLGVGGVRFLRALGLAPTAWHMNEGHSAFSVLERSRELVKEGFGFEEARAAVTGNTLFTVHTPVAAGNDAFAFELIEEAFGGYWGTLGLRREEFMKLGEFDHGWGPLFSMPALAIRFTTYRNGVAELHGDTTRKIWAPLFEGVPRAEVPIGHVTNGVHIATWVAPEMKELLAEVMPAGWSRSTADLDWSVVTSIEPERFWEVRLSLKAKGVRFLRHRLERQLTRHEATATSLHHAARLLDPDALTIGFARRFATYKRATLIFSDLERLARLLNDPDRPVQLIFAGKAHPADQEGQQLVAAIHNLSKDPRFSGKILFLEDYDISAGRALTTGVDVWLNNPRRPLEASGTSGMKAAMNGVLNLSILDGWWAEGFGGDNGWAIGLPEEHDDPARGDEIDADSLYTLLEEEVVPLYYQRDGRGVPVEWVKRSMNAVASVTPEFNAARMLREYVTHYYAPASERGRLMAKSDHASARELAAWLKHVREAWPSVTLSATAPAERVRRSGETLEVKALLGRGELASEVRIELVYGPSGEALEGHVRSVELRPTGETVEGKELYSAEFEPAISGLLAYGVRAYPVNDLLVSQFDSLALTWA